MKYFYISLLFLLSSRATVVPVTTKFPDVPQILTQPCPDLIKIEGEKLPITEMLKVVIHNYGLYWECAVKVDSWNKWYFEQKILFDNVNK